MFQRGVSVTLCRLVLASLDACVSILAVGKLLGKPFREILGVREGATESPHLFNLYIDGLRQALVMQHPRLCTLLDVAVAIILYADDAALPADSAIDLQLSAEILESFCKPVTLSLQTTMKKTTKTSPCSMRCWAYVEARRQ